MLGGIENNEETDIFINEVEYRISFSVKLKSLSTCFTTVLYSNEVGWTIALLLFLIFGIGISADFASVKMSGQQDQTYLLSSIV